MTEISPEIEKMIRAGMGKIGSPAGGDRVYKEECVFSFDSPETESGLYVSLNTFWGLGQDYVERYSRKTNESIFLHIRRIRTKIPKPQVNDGPERKVTRFAIGVEGGFDANAGDFDIETEETHNLVVIPGFHKIPLPNANLPDVVTMSVNAILAADSATKLADLEAMAGTWDGELRRVSQYASTLVQHNNGKKIPPTGWKCEVEGCNMTENLWLNLTDGAIFCGRRFFDGSGGNNHAIENYAKTKYPLAVKLGTITADGRADVFSYAEDEMVEDPMLTQHLAHFGINITQMEKTDKSMAEMEIDLNQRLGEWNTIQEAGTKLQPLYGPGFTGFLNLGNSCYMNSIMQVLFSIPTFPNRFATNASQYFDGSADPANDFNVQMSKVCLGLLSGKYSNPPAEQPEEGTLLGPSVMVQEGINASMFRSLIGKGHQEFSTKRQQDAQEFFLHLINVMERHSRFEQNPADCFKFQVEDKVSCDASGLVRYSYRVEYCLPLPIPVEAAINRAEVAAYEAKKAQVESDGKRLPPDELVRPKIPIEACLQAFIASEVLDPFYSSGTKRIGTASKFTRLSTFPDYLVIQLKKFTVGEDWMPKKLDVTVDMPFDLDLTLLKGQGLQPNEKELPDEAAKAKEPTVDEQVVAQLVEMGFQANASRRAVITTGNSGSEAAMEWIMQHLDDPSLNDPLDSGNASSTPFVADPSALVQVMSMGFTTDQATKALQATDNNIERAVDWIFSHPDEINSSPLAPTVNEGPSPSNLPPNVTDGLGKYKLVAFVSHMGSSSMVGHYVCHILKENQWVIFNDHKVAVSENLPKDLGYLYFYKRA